MYVFVGGLGARAGSALYDHFHRHLEKLLGRTPNDDEYPSSVLLTLPQRESHAFSGNFTIDFTSVDMIVNSYVDSEQVIVVPLCGSVSDIFVDHYRGTPVRVETLQAFMSGFPESLPVFCSATSCRKKMFGARQHVDATEYISSFSGCRLPYRDGLIGCTELSLTNYDESVCDVPRLFVERIMEEYYENSR